MTDTTAQEKPRGACTGCKFEYQLGQGKDEYKGLLVVRKHLSRMGPGECSGSRKPPRLEHGEATGDEQAFADPAPAAEQREDVPPVFYAAFDSEGSCGDPITTGDLIQADGSGGYVCSNCLVEPEQWKTEQYTHTYDDGNGGVWSHPGLRSSCAMPECKPASTPAVSPPQLPHDMQDTAPLPAPAEFTDPAPMPAELPSVSGQPEPDRDRWGRYRIHGTAHTRATAFAKSASSTHALSEWRERMVVLGLAMRPDLLAMAHGKHVKQDRTELNSIAEQAKDAAGIKVAANLGTAYHSFSERLDAGLCSLDDVPPQFRARLAEYQEAVSTHGLVTRPEWIERTTAVRADQVSAMLPVAGTLDRIFQLPSGELVIGDLKTGSDLSYGWGEIAVQLAVYAHGVNTFGLFDWNTKTWQAAPGPVRTDYGIVMHLPADGSGCTLYRIDLERGWQRAQVCGQVMAMQKSKDGLAMPLMPLTAPMPTLPDPQPVPVPTLVPAVPAEESDWDKALRLFREANSQETLAQLYQYALDSGKFHQDQLATLVGEGRTRLAALTGR